MTTGTQVKLRNYNVKGTITAITSDGYTVRDELGRLYFCFESELITIVSRKELVR